MRQANRVLRLSHCLFACLFVLGFGLSDAVAQTRVNSIIVDGTQRVPDATVIDLAGVTPGTILSNSEINDVLQRINASGLFQTVEIVPVGNTLRIEVVERPTVNRINIEGNARLSDEALLPLLGSEPRRVYSPTQAEADAKAIVDAYVEAGRIAATVRPQIIRRSDNRVDLVFEVTEGRVVENERISFVGNRAFSDRRLRRAIQTKQAGFLRSIIRADSLIPERIAFDRQALTDFYQSRGYVDFRVLDVTSEFSRERDASFLTFSVREGQRFSVGAVSVSSEFPDADINSYRDALRLRTGDTWNPAQVDEQIERLERLALQQGFDFLRVEPRVTRNARDLTLDVEFALVRGQRVFIERIDIEGNTTTLDRVIRRQFNPVEGDPFNPREIRNAAERIRALGYFESADVQTREGSSSSQVIVDVDVEEQPTGNLSFGGTFSTDTGFGLVVSFSERNFLGRGQFVGVQVQAGTEDRDISLNFREPALLDRDLSFGVSITDRTTDFSNAAYETQVTSISPSLGFPVSENGRLTLRYTLADEDIFNVTDDASLIIEGEAGSQIRSALGYDYTLDLLRGGLNPNRGILFSFGQEFAGLGGDTEFLKTTARVVAQRDILNEEVTLRAIFEGGAVAAIGGGSTRITDRFFLSSRQVRGFSSRGFGPRDTGAVESDVLGGNKYFAARFEADFPLGLPEEYGISGGVFLDLGSLWDLDNTVGDAPVDDGFELRSSIGFSLLWDTPVGPLRMNFSNPLKSNPLDDERTFDFTISTAF
ncbi:MAG: outer membrane protein assembly factor BamA [Boseongicola sp.]|nr:outer membrane protein assembly factor BamA [Boseongicola sp.]NNJ69504.1 outer membrane protein assembly factor BamA [Boseongicola sp.]